MIKHSKCWRMTGLGQAALELLRGILFIVRAGNDIIKADFMHTKRTNVLTKNENWHTS